ncbi:MAG TPA: YbaK/EbsC family protein [Thermoanaerobaculia bacterium]|jgi:prolyl-tRNA editing enzyme YbaK/EbsC (Cys-tRNA(Pro) deacylase)|nr:YbaK/EbsC family protein [Thermoanaerobaculia bacterium]
MLHPSVRAALDAASIQCEVVPCEPEWADTVEFCANYGIPPEEACNTIVIALKTTPRRYVACLVRSDTKLDVNHRVAAEVAFKRLSFASPEEAAQISGQAMGGVTIVGLPADIPILIDKRVMERPSVIIGGGNRTSKARLDPRELTKLPGARVVEIAVPR